MMRSSLLIGYIVKWFTYVSLQKLLYRNYLPIPNKYLYILMRKPSKHINVYDFCNFL